MAQIFNALVGPAINYQVRLIGELSLNWQSVEGNYSSVHRKVWTYRTGYTASSNNVYGYVDGVLVFNVGYLTISTSPIVIFEDDIVVYHNNEGVGSCGMSASLNMSGIGYSGGGSGSILLPTIPRAAKITAASDFNDEQNPSIGITNPGGWNMDVWLEPNPPSTHLCERINIPNKASYTWELTQEERIQLRKACKGNTCTIRIGIYSKNKSFTYYIDKKFSIINGNPVFTEADFNTLNHLDLADDKTVIKGYSNINVSLKEATPQKESTIALYKVVCGSKAIQGVSLSYPLESVDDSVIRCYATDSRGNTTEKIINVEKYIQYIPITLDVLEYVRSDGGIGTGVEITFEGSMWVGNFGLLDNTITAQYFYRERGGTDWLQGLSVINPTVSQKFSKKVSIKGDLGALGFDNGKAYDIKVVVIDKLSNKLKEVIVSQGRPHMAFSTDGVAIGGLYDTSITDMNGKPFPLQIYNNVYDMMIPIGVHLIDDEVKFKKNGSETCLKEFGKGD